MFAWILGGILLVLCIGIAGALIWLRTDHGEKTVASLAVNALAEQGLFLSMDELSGPLPSRLLLKNVRLADDDGEWFGAKELEIALNLTDILHKTATISLFRADTPEIRRLPRLAPSQPTDEPEPTSPGYFSLPLGITLKDITVVNLGIFAPLFFPEAGQPAPDNSVSPALFRASLQGKASAAPYQPLEASVIVEASVADMPGLAAHAGTDPLSLTGFTLTLAATATIGGIIEANVKGIATPEEGGTEYPVNYGLHAQLAGKKMVLRSLFLDGLGIRLDAKGGANMEPLAAQAEVDILTVNGEKWETLLTRISGQDMGGAVKAALKGSFTPDKAMTASATLSGTDMRWGMDQLQQLLGAQFTVFADASGGGAQPYSVKLSSLEAGAVNLSGEGSFTPDDKSLKGTLNAALTSLAPVAEGVSGALKAHASVSGTLDAPAATLEATSDSVTAMGISLEKLYVGASFTGTPQAPTATLEATLGKLSAEAGSVQNFRATGNLSGTMDAPAAVFEATTTLIKTQAATVENFQTKGDLSGTLADPIFSLTTTGDSVKTSAGVFGNVRIGMEGKAALPQNADKTIQVKLDAALQSGPAGPVALKTDLAASQSIAGALSARLSGLDVSLAGTDLMADITANIPAAQPGSKTTPLPSIQGTASADITDWNPIAALTGLPITGKKAGFDATFTHDANIQHITATIRADALTLPDTFSISGVSGSLEAHDLASPDISLTLGMGKGQVGSLDWETGAVSVNATRGNGVFTAALRTDKTAPDALKSIAQNAPVEPDTTERLTVAGNFAFAPMKISLDRLAARIPDSPLGVYLTAPASVELGETARIQGLRLNMTQNKGSIAVDAVLSGSDADVDAAITDLAFQPLQDAFGAPLPDGSLTARAVLKKKGATVQGTMDAKATVIAPVAGTQKMPPVVFSLASTLDQSPDPQFPKLRSGNGISRLKGNMTVGLDGQTVATSPAGTAPDAKIFFNLPLRFAANGVPEPAMNAPLGANVAWRGEIAPLCALAPMQGRILSGLAQIDADLKGTLEKPDYSVKAYVADGQFEDQILGVLLSAITVEASSSSAGKNILLMRAEDGQGGHVSLEGQLSLPQTPNSSVPSLKARGHINHLQPLHRDDVSLRLSGRLSVEGPLDSLKVGADVEVERGEISIQNIAGGVRTLEITDPLAEQKTAAAGPALDITVSIPNRFFIRGRGLDSEWEGTLAVRGTAGDPSLTGTLRPIRGTFDILSRPFAFSGGDISFMGGNRIDPSLNLALTHEGPNITAIIRATGRASKPGIKMESQPARPQDQIMADVLFGKEFSQLSRFETLQVANSVRQLANIGGNGLDPLSAMRTKLGIDMLRIGSSGSGGRDDRSVSGAPGASAITGAGNSAAADSGGAATPSLEAGKYINDAIYVGVEQGATANSTGVRVEVELLPNLSLQGSSSTNASRVGIGWKKDY